MFLFASDYDRKEKTLNILGVEINKSTGKISGD